MARESGLVRGIGLRGAITLNMINMIGVGPFVTLPLIVLAMHGPAAILGWVLGALLAACDGLVWAELGAAMPEAGGSYQYLRTIYGPARTGRYLSFLYIWQLSFSAPLSIASGCVGLAQYAGFVWPGLRRVWFSTQLPIPVPFVHTLPLTIRLGPAQLVAMGCCAIAAALLYRNIESVTRFSGLLWLGVMGTLACVIVTGLLHFHSSLAFDFPAGSFSFSAEFFSGLGAALLIATYDYWGAYNINFLGAEVRDPGRTIPKAIVWSVGLVAILYLLLNTSVLGTIPWRDLSAPDARLSVAAVVVRRAYGEWAGKVVALLVVWTAFSSVYALLLGYSRVPYAAALDQQLFSRVCARAPAASHSACIAADACGGVDAVLRAATGRPGGGAGGDPDPAAVFAAASGRDGAAPHPAGDSTALQDMVVSFAAVDGDRRLPVYPVWPPPFRSGTILRDGGGA